jgi:hypothetical protein
VTNMGGALFLLGGASTFTSTSFRYNHVEPARLIARGGGAYMIYGVMSIDAAEFIGNEVRAVAGSSGTAGAPPNTHPGDMHARARGTHRRAHTPPRLLLPIPRRHSKPRVLVEHMAPSSRMPRRRALCDASSMSAAPLLPCAPCLPSSLVHGAPTRHL